MSFESKLPGGDVLRAEAGREAVVRVEADDAQGNTLPRHDRDVAVSLNSFKRSDSGNAEAFAATYRDRLRYDWARRLWYTFDGYTFRSDDEGLVESCAKDVVRARLRAAAEIVRH